MFWSKAMKPNPLDVNKYFQFAASKATSTESAKKLSNGHTYQKSEKKGDCADLASKSLKTNNQKSTKTFKASTAALPHKKATQKTKRCAEVKQISKKEENTAVSQKLSITYDDETDEFELKTITDPSHIDEKTDGVIDPSTGKIFYTPNYQGQRPKKDSQFTCKDDAPKHVRDAVKKLREGVEFAIIIVDRSVLHKMLRPETQKKAETKSKDENADVQARIAMRNYKLSMQELKDIEAEIAKKALLKQDTLKESIFSKAKLKKMEETLAEMQNIIESLRKKKAAFREEIKQIKDEISELKEEVKTMRKKEGRLSSEEIKTILKNMNSLFQKIQKFLQK